MKAAHVASACAAVAGVWSAAQALVGDHTLLGVSGLAWPGAALLFVGAVAAAASVHRWRRRLPAWLVTASLGLVAASSLVGSCFLLLDLIGLAVTGSVTDRAGNSDWATFGERLGAAVLAALFTVAVLSWRRSVSGRCSRCGQSHPLGPAAVAHPAPHAAPRAVQWTAYAGCATFVPYLVIHGLGMAGFIPGSEHHYADVEAPLPLVFAAFVLGLVGPAVLLLLGLVRPWGMAFPRWTAWLAGRRVPRLLPLIPVWLVAPTLALYGIGSFVYAIAGGHDIWGLGGAASLAFGGYGCALTIAAVSYEKRTRPRCALWPTDRRRLFAAGAPSKGGVYADVESVRPILSVGFALLAVPRAVFLGNRWVLRATLPHSGKEAPSDYADASGPHATASLARDGEAAPWSVA